jgi:hypothetical protein
MKKRSQPSYFFLDPAIKILYNSIITIEEHLMKVGSLVRYIRDPDMVGVVKESDKFQFITRNYIIWNNGRDNIGSRMWFDDCELEVLNESR